MRSKLLRNSWNLMVTLLLWTYFMAGFLLFFAPRYLFHYLRRNCPEFAFQHLNQRFFIRFFNLLHFLIPRLQIDVPQDIRALRSTVVVCNHLSYLDPLLFIRIFPAHKTIVKAALFDIPIFGWFLHQSGYLPSEFQPARSDHLAEKLDQLPEFFNQGGNLFIFPEGTRSRDGRLGQFKKSAFSIARRYQRPVAVLYLENTDLLYPPGKFCFNTDPFHPLSVRLLAIIDSQGLTTRQLQQKAWETMGTLFFRS